MRKLRWNRERVYKDIVQHYVRYVSKHYRTCHAVFGGYDRGATINDHEYLRRSASGKVTADISVNGNNAACSNQDAFLSNENNKSALIKLISARLVEDRQGVLNCSGDADTDIVRRVLGVVKEIGQSFTVVADNTDVIVLLVYHWEPSIPDVYCRSEKLRKCWSIRDVGDRISRPIKQNILFLHAWNGCDTISAVCGQGKTAFLNKIETSQELQKLANTISDVLAENDVAMAGERLFILMYSGKNTNSLNHLRYRTFLEPATTSQDLAPEPLPPTERAARLHSYRVHLQVVIWKTFGDTPFNINPEDWGWKKVGDILQPIPTVLDVAAPEMLKFVGCNCKTTSANTCGSMTCSCRENGLKCVPACGDCQGRDCKNSQVILPLGYLIVLSKFDPFNLAIA